MVKITKDASQKNEADLLQATGQMIREHGLSVATVATIAAKANLTHGAIYRHFASKDALAAAAITKDFDRIVSLLIATKAQGGTLSDYLTTYLAEDHRDYFVWGCPVASLAAEMGRTDRRVQAAFCSGLQRNLDAIADLSGINDKAEAQSFAIAALAQLSGAMAMARATRSCAPDLSSQLLQAGLRTVLQDPRLPPAQGEARQEPGG